VERTRSFVLALDRSLKVRSKLKPEEAVKIETTLKDNMNLFSCTTADLPGVDPRVAVHRLSVFKESWCHKRKENWEKKKGYQHKQRRQIKRISRQRYLSSSRSFRFNLNYAPTSNRW